jgi:hypothetical protein
LRDLREGARITVLRKNVQERHLVPDVGVPPMSTKVLWRG